eukprot:528328-Rhodomonas_salina.2
MSSQSMTTPWFMGYANFKTPRRSLIDLPMKRSESKPPPAITRSCFGRLERGKKQEEESQKRYHSR